MLNTVEGCLKMNKLICNDCTKALLKIPKNSIDLTITSPPYDKLRDYKGYSFPFKRIARLLYTRTKPGGVVVWVVGDSTIKGSETGTSFRQALYFMKIGFNLHDTMIYAKNSFAFPSKIRYHQTWEFMFVFSKGKPKTFNPIKDRKNKYRKMGGDAKRQKDGTIKKGDRGGLELNEFGQRYNIWKYTTGGGHVSSNRIAHKHPAIFPEQLAIDHVKSWSNPGDTVLDPMMGSGTTCVAAKMLGRNYIGIDLSKEYVAIAKKRLEDPN